MPLSVIEAPTGHEDDDELESDNMRWSGSYIVFYHIGSLAASDELHSPKLNKTRSRSHKVSAQKSFIQSHSFDSQSKGSVSLSRTMAIGVMSNPSKEQLIDAVQRHFI